MYVFIKLWRSVGCFVKEIVWGVVRVFELKVIFFVF